MVVYLDLLFLFNFFINAILIYIIEIIYKEEICLIKIFLGATIGGILILGFLANHFIYLVFKISGGIIICLFGMKGDTLKEYIVKISSFYLVNFASVGLIASFNVISTHLFIISLSAIIVIYFIESNKRTNIFINSLKYNVSISFSGKSFNLIGFLDTGNFASLDNFPIIYLDEKYLFEKKDNKLKFRFYKSMIINTVNGRNYVDCYRPDSFFIKINNRKVRKKVLVVFTELQEFACLLNSEIFI